MRIPRFSLAFCLAAMAGMAAMPVVFSTGPAYSGESTVAAGGIDEPAADDFTRPRGTILAIDPVVLPG